MAEYALRDDPAGPYERGLRLWVKPHSQSAQCLEKPHKIIFSTFLI